MTQPHQDFLKDEIWMLTFGGAFQRNKVYKEGVSETEKRNFRKELQAYMESVVLPAYKKPITDERHSAIIYAIIEFSTMHSNSLAGGQLSVGTAQKLLNLVLKYYWSLGWLPEPPHFPIDSRIQTCLPVKSRMSWTKITSLDEYQNIIDCAKEQLKEGESLARWELANFRRN